MVPNCAAPAAQNSTSALAAVLSTAQSNGINFGADLECTAQAAAFVQNATAIHRQLYCGFYQVCSMKMRTTPQVQLLMLPQSRQVLCFWRR